MRVKVPVIAITGTPGTGKTSVCHVLESRYGYNILSLNALITRRGFYTGIDHERGCLIADLTRLCEYISMRRREEAMRGDKQKALVIEGHLAHLLQPDIAIVLRTSPEVLAERLRHRGFHARKIEENVEAEMLDVILIEAVELCGWEHVYEVDTTGRDINSLAQAIHEIIDAWTDGDRAKGRGDMRMRRESLHRRFRPGTINWLLLLPPT